jgi:hypothetical protein
VSGQHPDFTPVVDGREFGALVGQALPAARKLVEGEVSR